MFSTNVKKVVEIIFFCLILVTTVTCKKDSEISQQTSTLKHLKISVFVKNLQNPWGWSFYQMAISSSSNVMEI